MENTKIKILMHENQLVHSLYGEACVSYERIENQISLKKNEIKFENGEYKDLAIAYDYCLSAEVDYIGLFDLNQYIIAKQFIKKEQSNCYNKWPHFSEPYLVEHECKKYDLSIESIKKILRTNQIIVPMPQKMENRNFIYDYYRAETCSNGYDDLEKLKVAISEVAPSILDAYEYNLKNNIFYFFNDCIMSFAYFKEYISLVFSVLKKVDTMIDKRYYSESHLKQYAFFTTLLLGAFVESKKRDNSVSIYYSSILAIDNDCEIEQLEPAYDRNNVPVALVCSNEYVPYLSVYLRSLLDHITDKKNYDLIVFHKKITQKNQNILKQMCSEYENVSIRFFNTLSRIGKSSFYVAQDKYCEEAYYRVFVPWYMEKYDKAIVMDCDILVRCDLGELFEIDLEDSYAAGVVDAVFQGMLNGWAVPDTYEYAKNEMKMKNPYEYLNTGVMLFDFRKMREAFQQDDLMSLCTKKEFRCQEQDILNIILEGHIKFLNLCWNCYVRSSDFVTYGIKWAPKHIQDEFLEAIENPRLVHYIAYPKPWLDPRNEYGMEFWEAAQRTPFYEFILFNLIQTKFSECEKNIVDKENISFIRKVTNKIFPENSRRRTWAKRIYFSVNKFRKIEH